MKSEKCEKHEKYNQIITALLESRGVTEESDIEEFLSDKPKKTYDPSLLDDLDAGVDLILSELEKDSRICVYGDYDADGITSTALMLTILGHLTNRENLDYYIPSRFEEGYGLNKEAIKQIADRGFDMIITVDCGSVSADEVEYAKELGLLIVVTDHHNITDVMADCLLINPKRPGSKYPFIELSGCGVAFKVAQRLQVKAGLPKSVLTEVLDLVAIGTIGDIMPLLDENRTMVKFGLKAIKTGKRYGLRKLIEGAGLDCSEIGSDKVGFIIVPHLNASGRIEDASQTVKLLLAEEGSKEADGIVEDLLFKNRERRRLQQETCDSCEKLIADVDDFLLIKAEDAHEGIAGIVAGKIKDKYYRPTVIVTPSGDEKQYLKGTGRSIEGVNLYELLKKHENCFEKFGGHAAACGFLMPSERLEELRCGLLDDMLELKQENQKLFERSYKIDLGLLTSDISINLVQQLELLAPFGSKNPKPAFRFDDVFVSDVKYMGERNQHARFKILSRSTYGTAPLQCILFNKARDYEHLLKNGGTLSYVIGSVECQIWQGKPRIQVLVEHMD